MIQLVVELFVILCVFALIYWGVSALPLPAPLKQIIVVLLIVFGGLALLYFLYGAFGSGFPASGHIRHSL